ncbi:MAG: porin [Gammaproteobacteria bacterium]|nr:porin [Gammaproteobacteria bacterium]
MKDKRIGKKEGKSVKISIHCLLPLLSAAAWPVQAELEVTPYASLRAQVEAVSVDQAVAGEDDRFVGIRDAFSRFGVTAGYDLANGTRLGGQVEIPFNMGNFDAEDPTFFDDNSVRVAKLTASGAWGSAWIGKGWLPYYNNVAYPVDMFSSFYSGWATYARFREYAAVYSTPSFQGLTLTASAIELDPSREEGFHYVLSYSRSGLTISYAMEDLDSDNESNNGDTHGVALSYSSGPFYVAVKSEEYMPEAGEDQRISNIYASYALDKYTIKGMVADGDDNHWAPGRSAQFGIDYQYSDTVKLFAEYFSEERSYAILKTDADSYDTLATYGTDSDGQAFLLGFRYDI